MELPTPTSYEISEELRARRPALGLEVMCLVTRVVGIAFCRIETLNGQRMWSIEPPGDGKSKADGVCVDDDNLIVIGDGISKTLRADANRPLVTDLKIGDQVIDKLSGGTGRIREFMRFANGCDYASVVNLKEDGEGQTSTWEIQRLERTRKKNALPDREERQRATGVPPDGGPMRCAVSAR